MNSFPSGAIRWTSAGTLLGQVSGLLRLVLVSTVIGVDDIGRYAIAVALSASAGLLGDSGLRQLYLSRQADHINRDSRRLLSNVWCGIAATHVGAMVATLPLGLIYVWVASPEDWTVAAMAFAVSGSSFAASLQNPSILASERDREFAPGIKADSIGQIAALLTVCALLRLWPSAWLLVVGQGVAALVSTVSSYRLIRRPSRLLVDIRLILRLARAGRPYLWISLTTYVTASLDKLLIGIMLSPAAAGAFFLAQRFADAPRQFHASVLGRTVLPQYASSNADGGTAGLLSVAKTYVVMTAAVFALAFMGVAMAWGLFEVGAIGRKWLAIATILPILLAGTACRAACHVLAPALVVLGALHIEARLKIEEGIAYLVALPLSIHWAGVMGAAAVFSMIYAIALFRRYRAVRSATSIPGTLAR